MTLYEIMQSTAQKKPKDTAIVFYGKRYSFSAILLHIDSAATGLKKLGVKKGDVVTLCLPNTPSAQIAFYALNKLGAIINLVHPKLPPVQLNSVLKKTNSTMLVVYDIYAADAKLSFNGTVLLSKCGFFMGFCAKTAYKFKTKSKKLPCLPLFEDLLRNSPCTQMAAEFNKNEAAVYLPSGGTTGSPKIVIHSNEVFINLCNHAQFFLSEDINSYKAMYTVLPIFHGFGLCMNMMMCTQRGLKNVMSAKFSPKHLAKSIKKEGVNVIMGVPSMFNRLIKNKHFNRANLSSIKDCFVGGDSVPQATVEQFNAVLHRGGSRAALHVGYGLTETVAVCTVNNAKFSRTNSVGLPLPKTRIKIFSKQLKPLGANEVGEIGVSSNVMTLGYLDGASPIKNIDGEEWLLTGDLGYLDIDGYLFFKQRAKNMLKVNGVPVFPCEVEEVAQRVQGVTRAAAIGVKDNRTGEAVKLFLQVQSTNEAQLQAIKQQVIELCATNLICYAMPKFIEFTKALPTNEIGKVDTAKLNKEEP